MSKLWEECLTCESKCCNCDIASRLFVTQDEFERIRDSYPDKMQLFNKNVIPCPFLKEDQLCLIHEIKPVDCRLFPFDLMKVDDKLFWIIRDVNIDCPILHDEEKLERYLKDFEENIIPDFKPYLSDYALFLLDELGKKYKFKVLREVKYE